MIYNYSWNNKNISSSINFLKKKRFFFLKFVKNEINQYCNQNFNIKDIDLIYGDFIDRLMHSAYACYLEHSNVKKLNFKKKKIIYIFTKSKFSNLFYRDKENFNIIFDIINHLKNNIKNNLKIDLMLIKSNQKKNFFYPTLINQLSSKKIIFHTTPFNYTGLLRSSLSWFNWAGFTDDFICDIDNSKFDSRWRIFKFHDLKFQNNFDYIICALFFLTIPTELLENFLKYYNFIIKNYNFFPKALFSSKGLYSSLKFKILAKVYRDSGTKIFYRQHGGDYGFSDNLVRESYELNNCDKYFSWGWKNKNNSKIVPLSVPYINKKILINDKILFVNGSWHEIISTIRHATIGSDNFHKFKQETFFFLNNINIENNFYIRDNLSNPIQIKLIKNKLLKYDKIDNQITSYLSSKIVVHNYIQTSWLETLGLNIPTICFYDPNYHKFNPQSQKLVNNLLSIGVLHKSAKEAANFYNFAIKDLHKWWYNNDTQKIIKEFSYSYARFSTSWKNEWKTKLFESAGI